MVLMFFYAFKQYGISFKMITKLRQSKNYLGKCIR
jgi:hypothetical protein